MKKYLSFFRMRFVTGLQYRAAAAAGVSTQFAWGFMEIMVYRAFYKVDPAAFPMEFSAVVNYIWLQQAFLALFMAWLAEAEIFESISNGNIVYELCRPIRIYHMWFARSVANRVSRAVLRCMPILIVAFILPDPYGLTLPKDIQTMLMFGITLILGTLVTVAIGVIIYLTCFYTISSQGIRIFYASACELFCGQIVPLPFMPEMIERVLEVLPFASMQNVALRVFSNDLAGVSLYKALFLQVFWLILLVSAGNMLAGRAEKKIVLQGG